jgi:peptidoglycan/xylan/chitin deacetylase (PgdA/CDA1 family)
MLSLRIVRPLLVIVLAGVSFGVMPHTPAVADSIEPTIPQFLRVTPPTRLVRHPKPKPVPISAVLQPDYTLPPTAGGKVPILYRVPTTQKVVFLTIDDGATRTPDVLALLKKYHVRATLFLNSPYTATDPAYFRQIVAAGSVIESHTINHPDLTKLSYRQQVAEICGDANALQTQFGGARPSLFRPPYGSLNSNTLAAAAACGQRAIVSWHAKANGGSMQYQDNNTGLLPGDIVLIHFRPEFARDFAAFWAATKMAGLQPALLEDWLT